MAKDKKDLVPAEDAGRSMDQQKENDTQSAEDLEKMFDEAPPEMKKVISRMFSMQISSRQESGPLSSRFFDAIGPKINEEHINKLISNNDNSDKRQFGFSVFIQIRNILIVSGIIGVFIWLTIFMSTNNATLYLDLIKTIVAFLGGIGIGFGIKSYKEKK
jgi:hypothetical protein